jgi:hypothetical protein
MLSFSSIDTYVASIGLTDRLGQPLAVAMCRSNLIRKFLVFAELAAAGGGLAPFR